MSEDDVIKEKIFSACHDRFLREGFARTTVDEITTSLGMSKKTFYKYFSGKEDLVRQIMERVMGSIRTNVERIFRSDSSAIEKLSEFITMIGMTTSNLTPAFGGDIKKQIPQLWTLVEEFRRERISEVFVRLIKQGLDEGTIRADLNPRVFLMCVLGAIDRIMQPDILAHESFSVSDAAQEILRIFFRGGLTEKGRNQFEQLHTIR